MLASTISLRGVDWLVLAAYLLVILVTGVLFSLREQKSTRDYFLASRRMPAWAVACSILASSLSVATFLGAPEFSYKADLSYLLGIVGLLIGVIIVAVFFIPAFYRLNATTVYELLEHRFGPRAKHAASAAFMIGRVFASGTRVYIGAIPLAAIAFGVDRAEEPWALIAAIGALTVVAVLYTLVGGIASVIWTDVVQTCVMIVAILAAIVLLLHRIPAPVGEIVEALQTAGPGGASKTAVVVSGLDPRGPLGIDFALAFTVLTALIGLPLLNAAALGCDHDLTQRMLTCKSALQGSRSVLMSAAITLPVVLMFLTIGLLLFVFYRMPGLMGAAAPTYEPGSDRQVFVTFIIREMPPGLSGLMIAGLFAVGIGSLTSAINAMAATAVKDFYQHFRPGRAETHYLAMGRRATVAWGLVLFGFAVLCVFWQQRAPNRTLLDFALGVMAFAYSGLLAVFLTALFTRRGTSGSVVAALVVGFVITALLQPALWNTWTTALGFGTVQTDGRVLPPPALAWSWHMAIATPLAMAVCCVPRGSR